MKHWITIGVCGVASMLVLSSTTRAAGQATDGGTEDASTQADAGADDAGPDADGGAEDASVVADGGGKDAGEKADGGKDSGDGPAPLPEYDLIQRDDGGRACSAGGPGGSASGLSLAALVGLSAVVARRRRHR